MAGTDTSSVTMFYTFLALADSKTYQDKVGKKLTSF